MTVRRTFQSALPLLLAVSMAVATVPGDSIRSEQPDAAQLKVPDDAPIRFHRLLVPEAERDLFDKLIKHKHPLKLSEFEELVEPLRPAGAVIEEHHAHIVRGVYRARLRDNQLVDGEALLEIGRTGEDEATLSLGHSRLAVSGARWEGDPPAEALLYTDEDGAQAIRVDRSAPVKLNWSLKGESDPFGEVTFEVALPPGAANRLELELPAGLRPELKEGFVERGKAIAADRAAGRSAAWQWAIELGGTSQTTLRLVREVGPNRRLVLLRKQDLTYDLLQPEGKLTAELHLAVHHEPLTQLELELAAELEVESIHLGDEQLSFSSGDPAPDGSRRMLVVHFPKPLLGGAERTLRIVANLPVTVGQSWRLPGISVQNVSWQEGQARLRINEPLVLNRLETVRCRQSGLSPLPTSTPGQLYELQYYASDAEVEVLLEPPSPQVRLAVGTTLEVDSVIDATVVAEVEAARGRRFELEMLLPPAWTVESVRTEPADALYDYDVVPRGQQPQLVRLRLGSAISYNPAAPLRIVLRAHRRLPAQGGSLAMGQVRLARFQGAEVDRRLISIPASSPFQLTRDVRVERLDPLTLSEDDGSLVAHSADRVVLVDDARADDVRLALVSERPGYSAEVDVTAHVDAAGLSEAYRIQILPESAPVGRLLVHFSQPRDESPQWSLGGENDLALLAQRVSDSRQQSLGLSGGETWGVSLRRPRNVPFELHAARRSAGKGKRRVALVSVPQANGQSGTLTIESSGGAGLAIENQTLRAIPADNSVTDRYTNTRAVFRYEPSQDAEIDVSLSASDDAQPAVWAWSSRLTTWAGYEGAQHAAAYYLQSAGARQIEVRLPAECSLQQVLLDGREVRSTASNETGAFVVALPAETKYLTLEVLYRDSTAKLPAALGEVQPRLPELSDVPVLARRWTLWLPPGYGVESSGRWLSQSGGAIGARLFGPVWRSRGAAFQLFSEDDWADLFSPADPAADSRRSAARCLEILGRIRAAAGQSDLDMTWGQLFEAYDRSAEEEEIQPYPVLRVDAAALAAIGVFPQSTLPGTAASPAFESDSLESTAPASPILESASGGRGSSILPVRRTMSETFQAANLVLLASGEKLLVTSLEAVPRYAAGVPDLAGEVVLAVDSLTSDSPAEEEARGWLSGRRWAVGDGEPRTPWETAAQRPFMALSSSGWSAFRFDLDHLPDGQLAVYRPALFDVLGWGLLLIAAAATFTCCARRKAWFVPLLGLAAVAALLAPPPYVSLATGTFLGIVLAAGLAAALARRRATESPPMPEPRPPRGDTTRTLRVASLVLWLLAAGWGAAICMNGALNADDGIAPNEAVEAGNAAEAEGTNAKPANDARVAAETNEGDGTDKAGAPGAAAPPRAILFPVVVKVDKQRQPTGFVLIPEEFYQALVRRNAIASRPRHSVLLLRAAYEGRLAFQADETLAAKRLSARFDFIVRGSVEPGTSVALPLDCSKLDLAVDGARLDGQAADVDFEAERSRILVTVDRTGSHTLELVFRPQRQVAGRESLLDVPIPRIATSHLRVRFPRDATGIAAPTALGATGFDPLTGELLAELGPTDRLAIAWPTSGGLDPRAADLGVDEMLWLKVRPGSVLVDARLHFHRGGTIEDVRLTVDPRLRMLPLRADQPVREAHEQEAEAKTIHLELNQAFENEVTLHLSFLLSGASGVGNLRLPQVEPVADRITSRRLAVSVSPLLEYEQQGRLELFRPDRFAQSWDSGVAPAPPELAFTLPLRGEPAFSLSTRPKAPRTLGSPESDPPVLVTARIERGEAKIAYQADVTTEEGNLFQHHLAISKPLVVDEVSVKAGREEAASRWSRRDDGTLTIQLDRRVTGPQQIRVIGHLPLAATKRFSLPKITLLDAEPLDAEYRIYRSPDMSVKVVRTAGLEPLEGAAGESAAADNAVESAGADTIDSAAGDNGGLENRLDGERLVAAYRTPGNAEPADREPESTKPTGGKPSGAKPAAKTPSKSAKPASGKPASAKPAAAGAGQSSAAPSSVAPSSTARSSSKPGGVAQRPSSRRAARKSAPEQSTSSPAQAKQLAPKQPIRQAVACVLDVAPNDPHVACRSITALHRADGAWTAEVICRLDVSQGTLDEFWIDVPDRLAEPFEVLPPTEYVVVNVPGRQRRRIVIRPNTPISGQADFTLKAELTTPAAELVTVPDVMPLQVDALEQYVVVPLQADGQRLVWEPSGLQGAALPEGEPPVSVGEEAAVWKAVAPSFSASLKLLEPLASVTPRVRLADIYFAWERGGDCCGLATFNLQPAGLSSCVLELPADYRLVQVSVDGLPATLVSLKRNRWRMLLGPAQLPQQIVVLFEGRLPAEPIRRRAIEAPRLQGVTVDRTLWTLHAPEDRKVVHKDGAETAVSARQQAWDRYESIDALMQQAVEVAREQPRRDTEFWYLPWSRRLTAAREALLQRTGEGPLDAAGERRMSAIEERQDDDAERLKMTRLRSLAAATLGPADAWSASQQFDPPDARYAVAGANRLNVSIAAADPGDWPARLAFAATIAVAAVVIFLLTVRGPLGEWAMRWPHAVGVLVGLAWWLWLSPSVLGWAIVAVSVAAALRSPWKQLENAEETSQLSSVVGRVSR